MNVLRMEDGRVEACLIWESKGIASYSTLVTVQIGVQPKSMYKSKHGKNARVESSEKVKDDDWRKCYYCREAGHAKSQRRTRLKGLAEAGKKPVTANSRPSSIAADAPLVTMFLVTVPHVKMGRVRLTSAIPTCKTCLMMDTCAAEASVQEDLIKPHKETQRWQRNPSRHWMIQRMEMWMRRHKFQVRFDEADVGFIILSAGKTSQQSDWFESDGGHQVMLPGPSEQTRTYAKDSNVAKLEENRRVYWLPGSAADSADGAPLNMKFRLARLVVEATTDSETEFDATQLKESEETHYVT